MYFLGTVSPHSPGVGAGGHLPGLAVEKNDLKSLTIEICRFLKENSFGRRIRTKPSLFSQEKHFSILFQ